MIKLNLRIVLGLVCLALALTIGGCGGGGPSDAVSVILDDSGGGGGGSGGGGGGGGGGGPSNGNTSVAVSNTLPDAYQWNELSVGAAVYVDRTFTFTDVPTVTQGLDYLRTANDDKYMSDPAAITFDISEAATVLVAYDFRNTPIPSWLQSWTDTGDVLATSDTDLKVFSKDFSAGAVALGGNELGQSMYVVAINSSSNVGGPLTINGSPATSIVQGTPYSFSPTATGGVTSRTFSITNTPTWANFNNSDGTLTGTPDTGDIGTTSSNIVISVSDGQQTMSLAAFDITVLSSGTGSATLSWTAPTQNADNTPLTDLNGYTIYYGTSVGNYPNSVRISNAGITTSVIENLAPGTWSFVVAAFDTSGNESTYSNVANKTIQ